MFGFKAEDAGMAAEDHLSKTLHKVGVIDPVNLKQRQALEADFSLKREEHYLKTCVTDLEIKGFDGAAAALDAATEAIFDSRRRLKNESEGEA